MGSDSDSASLRLLRYDSTTSDSIRLVDDDGTAYLLEVTEDLRGAVRRLGALAQKLAEEFETDLRPRDIQALIRSGVGPEELAQAAGIDPDVVWRYAGPVVDERAWIAGRAQEVPVSRDDDAPMLGELALDRLATRGVSPDSMTWDALRDHGRWIVTLAYSSGDGDAEARWAVDFAAGSLEALDEEAAWISETVMPDGPVPFDPTRGLAGVDSTAATIAVKARNAPERGAQTSDLGPSLALLDDLMSARGLRQPVEPPFDEEDPSVADPADSTGPDTDGGQTRGGADILQLLPPLETEDTRAPVYSQLTLSEPDAPEASPLDGTPESEGAQEDSGRPSRRSILDRRHEVESDDAKTTRPPASPLEEDAAVGLTPRRTLEDTDPRPPASIGEKDQAGSADRRGRRRPARQTARDTQTGNPHPPSGDDASEAEPARADTPAVEDRETPAPAAASPGGAPAEGRSSHRDEPSGTSHRTRPPSKPPTSKHRPAPPPDVAAPTEVVALLPLDDVDLPVPAPPAKPKDTDEAKPRSRSRRSSVPSWDEIVFGAKPER